MKKAVQAYFTFVIFFTSFTVNAMANIEVELSQMEHEIHLKPWVSYQKLIAMQSTAQSYNETTYLWWLVRKAQAENFIYFFDDFNETVKRAAKLITNKTPIAIQSRLNIFQGLIYRRQGNYVLSEQLLSKALSQAKKANLSRLYIHGKRELAFTKVLTEYYETSLLDLQEAYVEAFTLKDLFLMASINEVYGVVYNYLKEYDKSVEYYKRALDTYKHLQYPAQIAKISSGLASTYRYWKKYDLAIKYFKQFQKDIAYTPNANENFFVAYGLSMTYAENGDCKLAITALERALQLKGLAHYDAELYKNKASCLIALGRLDEAEDAILNAENEFAKLPDLMGTVWQLEVIKISSELNYARGNYDLSYQMLKSYYQQYTEQLLKNSSKEVLKVKNRLSIKRQEMTSTLEDKRFEIELLKLENSKIINKQRLYFSLFSFFILLTFIVILVIQYRSNKKIQVLTIKDPLSNLFNRRYIFDYLSSYISNSAQGKIELAAILIDIDNLKKVNDEYGYPVGEQVICNVANIGKEIFRQCDVFSRIGGKKFFCVLPRTDIYKAEKIAQRYINTVNKSKLIFDKQDQITISIGIAEFCSQCHDATQLFVNAEQALYQAKQLGKNQVNIFTTNIR